MAAQHSTLFPLKLRTVLLVTMVTLQMGDLLSTVRALSHGAIEIGALGSYASNIFILFATKVICVGIFAAILYRDKFPLVNRLRWCALLCAFYACVVVSNLAI